MKKHVHAAIWQFMKYLYYCENIFYHRILSIYHSASWDLEGRREAADLARALELSTQQATTLSVLSPHWLSSSHDTSGATQDSKEMELRPIVSTAGEAGEGSGTGAVEQRNGVQVPAAIERGAGSGEIMPPPMTVVANADTGETVGVSSESSGAAHGHQSDISSFTPSNPNPILVPPSDSNSNPHTTPSTTHSSAKSALPPSSFPFPHRPSDPAYSSPMPFPPAAQPSPQYTPRTHGDSTGSHSHPSHVSSTELSSNRPLFSPTQVSSAPRSDAVVPPTFPAPGVPSAAEGVGEEPAPVVKKVKTYGKANRTASSPVKLPASSSAGVRAVPERQSPRRAASAASKKAAAKPKPKSRAIVSSDEEDEPAKRDQDTPSAAPALPPVPAPAAPRSAPSNPTAAAPVHTSAPRTSIEVILPSRPSRSASSRSPVKRPAEAPTEAAPRIERGRHSPDPLDSLDANGMVTPLKRPRGSTSSRTGDIPPAGAGAADTQQSELSAQAPSSASRRVSTRVADAKVKEEQEKEERRRKRREEKERKEREKVAGVADTAGKGEKLEGKGKNKAKGKGKDKDQAEQGESASAPISRVETGAEEGEPMEVDPSIAPAVTPVPDPAPAPAPLSPSADSAPAPTDPDAPVSKSRKRKSSLFDPHAPLPPPADDFADEDFRPGKSAKSKAKAKGKGKEKVVKEKKAPAKKGRKSGVEAAVPVPEEAAEEGGSGSGSAPATAPETASTAADTAVVDAEPSARASGETSTDKPPEEEEPEDDQPKRREVPTPPTPAPKSTSPPATTPSTDRERVPLGRTSSNLAFSTPTAGPSGLHRGSPAPGGGQEGTPSGGVRWKTPRNDLSSVLAKFGGTKRSGMSRNLKIQSLHAKIGPPAKALPPVPKKVEKKKKGEESDEDDEDEEAEMESDGEGGLRKKKKVKGMEWYMVED
ncbi:hypothetical protein IAT38_008005 [Cryptococcus sp. DSM 104549]